MTRCLVRWMAWLAAATVFATAGLDMPSGSVAELVAILSGSLSPADAGGVNDEDESPPHVTLVSYRASSSIQRRPAPTTHGPAPDHTGREASPLLQPVHVRSHHQRLKGVCSVLRC